MDILQLKYFCNAAKTQNFSETARNFSVPPSDISQTVARLEKELGCNLFERHSNKIRLSENGRAFYQRVSKGIELIEDACTEIKDTNENNNEQIKICITTNINVITNTIDEFKNRYPNVSFYINHRFFENETYDFVIANDRFSNKSYLGERVLSEPIALAVSNKNSLSREKKLTAEKLFDKKFVTMQSENSLYEITNKICYDMGFVPKIAIQSDNSYFIRKYVEMDLGIAFIPKISWGGQFSENVTLVELNGYKQIVYLFRKKTGYMTKAVTEFYKMVKEGFARQTE